MKTFKYFRNKISYFIGKLKNLHENLKQIDADDLRYDELKRNPYQVLFDWSLEVLQYGSIATLAIVCILSKKIWLLPVSLGCIRYLWIDIVENTFNAARGQK